MSYKITKATEEDVPELLGLIVDLAVYEKEPDAVTATPELMIENVFKKGYAESLIVRTKTTNGQKGEAVGLALYFFTYSTWLGTPGLYLEDLYVKPEHRAKGLGKKLFGELGVIAKERKCSRVEWRVLKWNQPSIDFYVQCVGATPQSEWEGMRLEGAEQIGKLLTFRD